MAKEILTAQTLYKKIDKKYKERIKEKYAFLGTKGNTIVQIIMNILSCLLKEGPREKLDDEKFLENIIEQGLYELVRKKIEEDPIELISKIIATKLPKSETLEEELEKLINLLKFLSSLEIELNPELINQLLKSNEELRTSVAEIKKNNKQLTYDNLYIDLFLELYQDSNPEKKQTSGNEDKIKFAYQQYQTSRDERNLKEYIRILYEFYSSIYSQLINSLAVEYSENEGEIEELKQDGITGILEAIESLLKQNIMLENTEIAMEQSQYVKSWIIYSVRKRCNQLKGEYLPIDDFSVPTLESPDQGAIIMSEDIIDTLYLNPTEFIRMTNIQAKHLIEIFDITPSSLILLGNQKIKESSLSVNFKDRKAYMEKNGMTINGLCRILGKTDPQQLFNEIGIETTKLYCGKTLAEILEYLGLSFDDIEASHDLKPDTIINDIELLKSLNITIEDFYFGKTLEEILEYLGESIDEVLEILEITPDMIIDFFVLESEDIMEELDITILDIIERMGISLDTFQNALLQQESTTLITRELLSEPDDHMLEEIFSEIKKAYLKTRKSKESELTPGFQSKIDGEKAWQIFIDRELHAKPFEELAEIYDVSRQRIQQIYQEVVNYILYRYGEVLQTFIVGEEAKLIGKVKEGCTKYLCKRSGNNKEEIVTTPTELPKTICAYFPNYTEEEIKIAIEKLTKPQKRDFYKVFGYDLNKLIPYDKLESGEIFMLEQIIPAIRSKLNITYHKRNEKPNHSSTPGHIKLKKQTIYEWFESQGITRAIVELELERLTIEEKRIIREANGGDLTNPKYTSRTVGYNTLLNKMLTNINNREGLTIYEWFSGWGISKEDVASELVNLSEHQKQIIREANGGSIEKPVVLDINMKNNLAYHQLLLTIHSRIVAKPNIGQRKIFRRNPQKNRNQ